MQSISFLGYLRHFQGISGPHLIVAPKSTITNWHNEVRKWTPDVKAFVFHGNKEERAELIRSLIKPRNFDLIITSYEMCLIEKSSLKNIEWQYIVIDEAHRIKNEGSLLSKIVRIFRSSNRLLLTGTPLQNNLHELWALLNFLMPDVFSSSQEFDEWFSSSGDNQQKEHIIQQLRKLLSPFLLRRIKSDVEKALLPKKEINLYVQLSDMQRLWYQKILEKDIDAINGSFIAGKKEGKTRLMNIVMQLRKVSNHPYLFDGAEPGPPYSTGSHIIENSGKMRVLDKLLENLKKAGSRVLLFSQMSRMLDILEDYCFFKGYTYCRLDGQTPTEERIQAIEDYNVPKSKKFIFLLTTRAGGLGINLTSADVVILYDSDWNPQVDLQAQDRAHRIGQQKQVKVFRLLTENTVEEKVIERAMQKLRLDQLVIQQGRQMPTSALSNEDLLVMIRHGARDIIMADKKGANNSVPADDSLIMIEEIMRKGEEKTAALQKKYSNADLDDLQRFTSADQVNTYQWEGADYGSGSASVENVSDPYLYSDFLPASKRERKSTFAPDSIYGDSTAILPKFHSRSKAGIKRVYDFQFPSERLLQLQNKELLYLQQQASSKGNDDPEDTAKAQPLSESEIREKNRLLEKCFHEWTKKDFGLFVKACEKHGRRNYAEIAKEIESKSVAQVKEYGDTFWKSYKTLDDYEKIIASIERGEARIQKLLDVENDIAYFSKHYDSSVSDFSFPRSKLFNAEEDRFLLFGLNEIGYSSPMAFERLREEIRRSSKFKFDWFLRTRTAIVSKPIRPLPW